MICDYNSNEPSLLVYMAPAPISEYKKTHSAENKKSDCHGYNKKLQTPQDM